MRTRPIGTLLALAVLALAAGCGKPAPKVLHVYTWADYVKPELVQRFEQANDCRVVIDTFDSNESMYAKLKAGASGYDIVTPSSYMVALMHQQGMLPSIAPSSRTRRTWTPRTSRSRSIPRWRTACRTCSPTPASPT